MHKNKLIKAIKYIGLIFAIFLVATIFIGCNGNGPYPPNGGENGNGTYTPRPNPLSITAITNVNSIEEGRYALIRLDTDGVTGSASWAVANSSIVSIDQQPGNHARVNGIAAGSTTITASLGGYSIDIAVTVIPAAVFYVSHPDLNNTLRGTPFNITVTTDMRPITFTSSATTSMTVVGGGAGPGANIAIVNPIAAGVGIITVAAGGRTITIPFSVVEQNVVINDTTINLLLGEYRYVSYTPVHTTSYYIDWHTSDPTVVAVNGYGRITALRYGTADITAQIRGTAFSDSVRVNVLDATLEVTLEPSDAFMPFNSTLNLIASAVLHTQDGSQNIPLVEASPVWTSSSPNIATVVDGVVTSLSVAGETTIRLDLTWEGESFYALAQIRVDAQEVTLVGTRAEFLALRAPLTDSGATLTRRNIQLTADIDMQGYHSPTFPLLWFGWGGAFSGTLDGNGFRIFNVSARFFANGLAPAGVIRNLHVDMTLTSTFSVFGSPTTPATAAAAEVNGIIENSIFELRYIGTGASRAAVATRAGEGVEGHPSIIRNSLFKMRGATSFVAGGNPLFVDGSYSALLQNVIVYTTNNISHEPLDGVSVISGDALTQAATFSLGFSGAIWNITNGFSPRLRNAADFSVTTSLQAPEFTALETNGGTLLLNATTSEPLNRQSPLMWASDNPSLVTVNNNGVLTAIGTGTGTVTISVRSVRRSGHDIGLGADTITVTVVPPIAITPLTTYMLANSSYQLQLDSPRDFVEFISAYDGVLGVDANGLMTARLADNTVNVTVRSMLDRARYQTIAVRILPAITFSAPNNITANADSTIRLAPFVNYGGLYFEIVNGVNSANLNVGIGNRYADLIIPSGLEGNEIIVRVTSNLDYRLAAQYITIAVVDDAPVVFNLSHSNITMRASVNETFNLSFDLFNAPVGSRVVWSSNNVTAVSINNQGMVTAGVAGSAIITASLLDASDNPVLIGGVAAVRTVAVNSVVLAVTITSPAMPISPIFTAAGYHYGLPVGGLNRIFTANSTLGATFWVSNNPSVVSVNTNVAGQGVVIGVAPGSARIELVSALDLSVRAHRYIAVVGSEVDGVTRVGNNYVLENGFSFNNFINAPNIFTLNVLTAPIVLPISSSITSSVPAGIASVSVVGNRVNLTVTAPGRIVVRVGRNITGTAVAALNGGAQDIVVYVHPDSRMGFRQIGTAAELRALSTVTGTAAITANATGNFILTNNINMGGATFAGPLIGGFADAHTWPWATVFNGTLDGNGHMIYNFTARGIFQLVGPNAIIRNIHFVYSSSPGTYGPFGSASAATPFRGTIYNTIVDVNFTGGVGARGGRFGVAANGGTEGIIRDSIFILRNVTGVAGDGLFRDGNAGMLSNVFLHVAAGTPIPQEGVTIISVSQLTTAATFSTLPAHIWDLRDGHSPRLWSRVHRPV